MATGEDHLQESCLIIDNDTWDTPKFEVLLMLRFRSICVGCCLNIPFPARRHRSL